MGILDKLLEDIPTPRAEGIECYEEFEEDSRIVAYRDTVGILYFQSQDSPEIYKELWDEFGFVNVYDNFLELEKQRGPCIKIRYTELDSYVEPGDYVYGSAGQESDKQVFVGVLVSNGIIQGRGLTSSFKFSDYSKWLVSRRTIRKVC